MNDRARLTPVDIAYVGVAVFVFGLLIGPIYTLLNLNIGALGAGDVYLFRMVIPAALIGVLVMIMATSVSGD